MNFTQLPHRLFVALLMSSVTVAAHAQDSLTETLTPDPRPYPYAILDIQPGAEASHASSIFSERMMLTLVPEEVALRVENGDGRAFELTFEQRLVTQGVSLNTRLSSGPYAQINAMLATEAMGGRVLDIQRTIREPNENLPDLAAILDQLEEKYGPPSQRTREGAIWAWGEAGFIPDLDDQPTQEITTVIDSTSRETYRYRPCTGYTEMARYRFRRNRNQPIMPGCTALFTVRYESGARLSTVYFSLADYDLIRQHVAEVDRQIVDALTSDAPDQTPSAEPKLDL